MTMISTKPVAATAPASTPLPSVLPRTSRLTPILAQVIPPLLVTLVLVGLWEYFSSGPGATLPPPSVVWTEANELIMSPFYDLSLIHI